MEKIQERKPEKTTSTIDERRKNLHMLPFVQKISKKEDLFTTDDLSPTRLSILGYLKTPGSYKQIFEMLEDYHHMHEREDIIKAANLEAYLSLDYFRKEGQISNIIEISKNSDLHKNVRITASKVLVSYYIDCWAKSKNINEKLNFVHQIHTLVFSDNENQLDQNTIKTHFKKTIKNKHLSVQYFLLNALYFTLFYVNKFIKSKN